MTSMETALIAVRVGQYLGSAVLFGGALLFVRQPTSTFGTLGRRLLLTAAILLTLSTLAALFVQAANMAGENSPLAKPSMAGMVLTSTGFGYAVGVRVVATVLAVAALAIPGCRSALSIVSGLGAVATASLAWGGHGMADDGWKGIVHLGGDIVHLLAANAWIGALAALLTMAIATGRPATPAKIESLHAALEGFAGFGTLAVALLVGTGLVNGWFLVGPARIDSLTSTRYGELLLAKLAVFVAMLGLAALNRWRLTPALGVAARAHGNVGNPVAQVRRSIVIETAFAVTVVLLVSWLGTLSPPNAG